MLISGLVHDKILTLQNSVSLFCMRYVIKEVSLFSSDRLALSHALGPATANARSLARRDR